MGPVAISIKREKASPTSRLTDPLAKGDNSNSGKHNTDSAALQQYRVIVRTSEVSLWLGLEFAAAVCKVAAGMWPRSLGN